MWVGLSILVVLAISCSTATAQNANGCSRLLYVLVDPASVGKLPSLSGVVPDNYQRFAVALGSAVPVAAATKLKSLGATLKTSDEAQKVRALVGGIVNKACQGCGKVVFVVVPGSAASGLSGLGALVHDSYDYYTMRFGDIPDTATNVITLPGHSWKGTSDPEMFKKNIKQFLKRRCQDWSCSMSQKACGPKPMPTPERSRCADGFALTKDKKHCFKEMPVECDWGQKYLGPFYS